MPRLTTLARQLARVARTERRALATRGPVVPGTVLYESFAGNGVLCNPEAIFRELLRRPDLSELRHTWVLDDLRKHRAIQREFAGDARVRFVRRLSPRYFRALATSEYLVNNATFPPEFAKREGQTYLNTWHGTPLKAMGYDMPNGAFEAANTLRNFLAADVLLSQNRFMTEQMYETAYRLRGAYRGVILEEGYPRVDRQLLDHDGFLAARARLESAGLDLGDRTIVLYAPTWKGTDFSSPEDDARELLDHVLELQELLGSDRYRVLLKTHQAVHAVAAGHPELHRVLVPNDLPTNLVLGVAGVLVTDYSSIFFDFLASNRPIVFFTPDAVDYREERGTYFSPDQLPGPVCATVPAVAEAILANGEGAVELVDSHDYQGWRDRFAGHDDGRAARRVVDAVFRGVRDPARVVSLAEDSRTPILLHLGGMRSNGITSSALNLLRSIDHDRYDVSAIIARPYGQQQRSNQELIDPRVRQFHRMGGMNGSRLRRRDWAAEWARCFGDLSVDSAVDFSGYSPFWARLVLAAQGSAHAIWLHNDLAAEQHRVIRGRRRMRRSLGKLFALYPAFDSLVSVSPSLSGVNRVGLAARYGLRDGAFVSARNLVDAERVVAGMGAGLAALETDVDEAPAWLAELRAKAGTRWFVSVGRFSTEKNQARLLRAFAHVRATHPEARLVVVGYGPLRSALEELIDRLGLTGAAFLAGPYPNPFPILAAADCFVLSSDYEGQPMVILEAAIAGLPIVSVDFDSVRDALPSGELRVTLQGDVALADGMLAFLAGEVAPAGLDAAAYNAEAIAEFCAAVAPGRSRAARPPRPVRR